MNEANLPTWVQWLNVVTHEAHTDGNGALCTLVQTDTSKQTPLWQSWEETNLNSVAYFECIAEFNV